MLALKIFSGIMITAVCLVLLLLLWLTIRFYLGQRKACRILKNADIPQVDLKPVKELSILPLIDRVPLHNQLAGEAGVSYLLKVDDQIILFDVGLNAGQEHPSPLLRNMQHLNIDIAKIQNIVISHRHSDHVGGLEIMKDNTFALSSQPTDLSGIDAFVPVPMKHATAAIHHIEEPCNLTPSVATTGPLPRQLFVLGWTLEQSLVVHIEGKGLVIISGCGHPTIQEIILRVKRMFPDIPIYGILGGLHYPVSFTGLWRVIGSGKAPWNPINHSDVARSIEFIRAYNPQVVSLSPHDSCQWSLEAFRSAFGDAYHNLLVGQEIVFD